MIPFPPAQPEDDALYEVVYPPIIATKKMHKALKKYLTDGGYQLGKLSTAEA